MADSYFVDTSALGKRYIAEAGSPWLRAILEPTTGCTVVIVRTTTVEMIAAISRRERGGGLLPVDAATARTEFYADLANEYQIVELSPALAKRAMGLAERHALRGYDAIQLAAALEIGALRVSLGLPAIVLLSADVELNAAATTEGVPVEDPNAHP